VLRGIQITTKETPFNETIPSKKLWSSQKNYGKGSMVFVPLLFIPKVWGKTRFSR